MTPFFSIVIPTYNRATMIGSAINSIIKQTFTDFEIIVVDDGSTDNTESIVEGIFDKRIKYFKKINEERSIARNFGIEHAEGTYINFLDSDDVFYPDHLKTAHSLLLTNEFPEIGHLGYELKDSNGIVLLQRSNFSNDVEEEMFRENILHGNAIFIKRMVALQFPFLRDRNAVVSEDWYVWLRLIARYKVAFGSTITSAIIEHGDRSLRNVNPDKLIASTELIVGNLKKDEIFMSRYKSRVAAFFADQYTLVTLVLALTKKRRLDTIKFLLKATRHDFSVIFRRRFLASVKHWF